MERKRLPLILLFHVSLSVLACACAARAPHPGVPPADGHTLYDRLGGKEGVHGVVDALLTNLLADSRVNPFFRGDKGLPKLEQQLCELSGGPCRYVGKDMKAAHSGMGITGEQLDAFLEDLRRALREKGVSRDEDELLGALAPMRRDIVEKKR